MPKIRSETHHVAATIPLLAALACAPVGSLGKDFPPDSSTSSSAIGPTSTGTDTTTGTSTGGTATGSSADATTGTHGSDSTGATETTGAHICPPLAQDEACATCSKDHCCDALTACTADPVCLCLKECHVEGTPIADCEVLCGTDSGENAELEQCLDEQCATACR